LRSNDEVGNAFSSTFFEVEDRMVVGVSDRV
jgi:hypothetical protein